MTLEETLSANELLYAGVYLHTQKRVEAAQALYRACLSKEPNNLPALSSLGGLLAEGGALQEADDLLQQALHIDAKYPAAWFNRGILLQHRNQFFEAEVCFDVALSQNVQGWEETIWGAKGTVKQYTADWDGQIKCYHKALAIRESPVARMCLGMTQMLLGQWHSGLANYESRLKVSFPGWPLEQHRTPVVNLDSVDKLDMANYNRVMVIGEQGVGDLIHFARYGRKLHSVFPWIEFSLFCSNEAAPLLKTFPGWAHVYCPADQHCHDVDAQVAMMSIPRLLLLESMFRDNDLNFTPHVPVVTPEIEESYKHPGMVGLCFAGNPKHTNDRFRSIKPEEMHGVLAGLVNAVPSVIDASRGDTWLETAQRIKRIDMVISVDTAVAHLAASLGIPTWLMLPANPDWRWGVSGETTPWYPSMTLFRQKKLGDWGPVLTEIKARLAE